MTKASWFAIALAAAMWLGTSGVAHACGGGEAPEACGDESGESGAKYMLRRVAAAVDRDQAAALRQFARGENGFRTADTYVFCVGPDGVMSAHPSPLLQGQDVHDLHDETGNHFIATMMRDAKQGQVSQIRYLFPRPGSTKAIPKTTFYTRAGDQVCGVGVYDASDPARDLTPTEQVQEFRRRLTAEMPASASADWDAFQAALDARDRLEQAAAARAVTQLKELEAAFATAAR